MGFFASNILLKWIKILSMAGPFLSTPFRYRELLKKYTYGLQLFYDLWWFSSGEF